MTRLFDPPDPNPATVLETMPAQGVTPWADGLEMKPRAVWNHDRNLNRSEDQGPLALIALVASQVSLDLYQDPGSDDDLREKVCDYADDYLRKLLYFGLGFSSNARELGDQLSSDYSPCITIHSSIRGGSWYVMGERDALRTHLLLCKEDPVLSRFVERFKEQYPKTLAVLERDYEKVFSETVRELTDTFRAIVQKKTESRLAS